MKGLVQSIERFGTLDGPGIRMVVFLNGCPMHCKFCHNPEIAWGKEGDLYTPGELFVEYTKNHCFYQKGGVTFSGGEPLVQGEFVLKSAEKLKVSKVHLAIDTSLSCGDVWLEQLFPYIDLWMIGIKAITPSLHLELTGRDNELILKRTRYLSSLGADLLMRYIIIPGFTDTMDELTGLVEFICSLPNPVKVELLPYHTMGVHKWGNMGLDYEFDNVPEAKKEDVERAKSKLQSSGIQLAS